MKRQFRSFLIAAVLIGLTTPTHAEPVAYHSLGAGWAEVVGAAAANGNLYIISYEELYERSRPTVSTPTSAAAGATRPE